MKHLFLIVLIASNAVSAGIYKCIDANERVAFSDKPCPPGNHAEEIEATSENWVSRLKHERVDGVEIVDISSSNAETTIKYKFRDMEGSTDFIRAASRLSGMKVALLRVTAPENGVYGSAEIKVSDKMKPLFDRSGTREASVR